MNKNENKVILFVDDDIDLCDSIRRKYSREFNIIFANNGVDALEKIYNFGNICIIISDYMMSGMDGLTLLSKVKEILPESIRVLITGHANLEVAVTAINEGNIFRFINKPIKDADIRTLFNACLHQHSLQNIEKVSLIKTEFLSLVSHEVRTPLNSIVNYLSLIKEGYKTLSNDEFDSLFNIVEKSSNRLIRTINLIVNVSELFSKTYSVSFNLINIDKQIIQPLLPDIIKQMNENNIRFEYEVLTEKYLVVGDVYCLQQIFINIIENSINFTAAGEINIKLYFEDKLKLSIKDTGIGITQEFLEKIFEPFTQETSGYSRKYDGNGLGLTLVKKYSELNDIDIQIKSQQKIGTEVILSFNNTKIIETFGEKNGQNIIS